MRRAVAVPTMLMAAALPARAQYQTPAVVGEPAARLAEMIALYDAVCLRAFPDDAAAARAVRGLGGEALSATEVRAFLHEDPGIGWRVAGRTGRIDVTIEQSPPYHACAVRAMTAAGFADLGPYQRLADAFEAGKGFARIEPADMVVGQLRMIGGGERREAADGAAESLLVLVTSPAGEHRVGGNTAVEVRFAHQIVAAGPGS